VKRNSSALSEAECVLKKSKPSYEELHASLSRLTDEHRLLQQWYSKVQSDRDRAYDLLVQKYELGETEEEEAVRKANRRAVVTELVGEGYCMSGSKRTFHRAKALALGAIKSIAGSGNTFKQQQIAEALLSHYSSGNESAVKPGGEDYEAHAAVIAGIVETLETRGGETMDDSPPTIGSHRRC
jgi:hypothetical protein